MKNVIIFGAGEYGKTLCRMIGSMDEYIFGEKLIVRFFCDNFLQKDTYIEGIKIIRPLQITNLPEDYNILISSVKIVDEVMKQLFDLKIKNDVYIVPDYVYKFRTGHMLPSFVKMDIKKPRIPYLECPIVKHCNLNCSGCSAMSNISQQSCMDICEFENDLKRLKLLYSGIKYFKLYGGEPLLHPMLKDFIKISRLYFPDAEIVVHSNGILIPEIHDDILKMMYMCNAKFVFTLYPATGIKRRKIEEKLKQANVDFEFGEPIYEFRKYVNIKGNYDPKEVFENCCKCINLIEGTLSCGFGYGIQRLEKKYNIEICKNKFEHCINIYTTDLDGWKINDILDSPVDLCGFCAFMNPCTTSDKYYFPWKIGKNFRLEDWSVEVN